MTLREGTLTLLATIAVCAVFALANTAQAATRTAQSEAECDIIRAAFKASGKTGECVVGKTPYNPDTPGVSLSAAEAKKKLKALPRGQLSECAPASDDRNIDALNLTFAICAALFLEDYTQKYGRNSILITSAFRNGDPGSSPRVGKKGIPRNQSANDCAGGVKNSNHTHGVAMDVHETGNRYDRLEKHAIANPQFGVCFPIAHISTKAYPNGDKPHMILAGINHIESRRCAAQGITKACTGLARGTTKVDDSTPTPDKRINPGPPSTDLTKTIREALKPPPMMMMPPPPPSSPLASMQSPLGAFQPSQMLPSPQPITPTSLDTKSGASSSIADKLSELVESPPKEPAKKENVVPVIVKGDDAGTVTKKTDQETEQPQPDVGSIQPVGQQTFVSADLATSQYVAPSPSQTVLQQALSTLRTALLALSEYLRPMGLSNRMQELDTGEERYEGPISTL